jgi:CRP/FNR family cyclic AMP-dependent transcriptional regulator
MAAGFDFTRMATSGRKLKDFAAGETIFAAGDPGDFMYFVKSGSVDIMFEGRVLETIPSGGIFGEMALVDAQPRSAGAVAKEDCQLAALDEDAFTDLVSDAPYIALQVMRSLVKRLRRETD